jgi:exodeoxyribonuclease VII large subunit
MEKLEVLNPLNTLKRGYTIVKRDNQVIDIINLKNNDVIDIVFDRGIVTSKIIDIKEN